MTVAVKQIEPRRLYQLIADQIRGLIQSGKFPPGSRLPPERDLATQLGVSRPSLREALIALEIDGSVEIRMGSGVYVGNQPLRAAASTAALGDSPSELMAARAALEGVVVAQAAARIDADGLARLREHIEAMRTDIAQARSPILNDRLFHLAIAEMAGNSVMARLIAELFDERHSPISTRLRVRSESARSWDTALSEHEAVYAALEARDPMAASLAMRLHLTQSSARWVGD